TIPFGDTETRCERAWFSWLSRCRHRGIMPRLAGDTESQLLALSRWYELERCEYALRFLEAFDPFLRAFCVVFLGEGDCYCVAQARAADEFATDGDFEI